MHWTRLVEIVLVAGGISTLTDWLFTGDWIRRRFSYPEIWRQGSEGRAMVLTAPLPFLTCAVFALAAMRVDMESLRATVKLAAFVWIIGPLPLILTNAAFIKLRRVFVASYATGWLVKLLVVAVVVSRFPR
jgi:hypothetical protein